MALLQIAEPGQAKNPRSHEPSAGIDLGTTNSLVAIVRKNIAETLPEDSGDHLLPSIVNYTQDGVLVGREASERAVSDPHNTIASVKRLMGRDREDMLRNEMQSQLLFDQHNFQVPRIKTRAGNVTAVEVSAEILRKLARRATEALGEEPSGVVVTVPAYFDDAQRQATKDAVRLAGLNLYRLLNEPTAAAIAYGLDREAEGVHAIYDLGGGTFDISILRLQRGLFEVLATGGDSALGGDDIDQAIAHWIQTQAKLDTLDAMGYRRLLSVARQAKEGLTCEDSVPVALSDSSGNSVWIGTLSRTELKQLIMPLVDKTLAACRYCLRDAGIKVEEVDEVVMVGGSTRIPYIRERVGALFGRKPLVDIDPDRVVAIGAAIQADRLAGNRSEEGLLLLDVTPLSLGIETMGGLVEKIIPRNSRIPVARSQEFTTFKDGQTAMSIHVLQGEREMVTDCRPLAQFELTGIPPMVAGAARVQVTFNIDADGLLSVEAREVTSGIKAGVTVIPSYGLSEDEISTMLRTSFEHAGEDRDARKLREVQVEALRTIEALETALKTDGELLVEEERYIIDQALKELRESSTGSNATAIEEEIKRLEQACEFYVERRMNKSIREAMKGRALSEFRHPEEKGS